MDVDTLVAFWRQLDRAYFIDNEMKALADVDAPLPIGFDQSISQPSLVLEMTRMLSPEKNSRVLEIGTGSGYQTAILAEFSASVYTIERIAELSHSAQKRLDAMGYTNIFFKIGDGSEGLIEYAPYDRIMVTAAAGKMPAELIEQLANKGRMIIPVGERGGQTLLLVTKDKNGVVQRQSVEMVRFVEMKGKYGWSDRE